jgi:hypothetical protein
MDRKLWEEKWPHRTSGYKEIVLPYNDVTRLHMIAVWPSDNHLRVVSCLCILEVSGSDRTRFIKWSVDDT